MKGTSPSPPRGFRPLDPEVVRDPHATFAKLRASCPVAHSDELGGFWLLTRYEDVVRVATDTSTFISGVQNVIPKLPDTGKRGPLHLDPPEHTVYRRALNPAFAPQRVAACEGRIREVAEELVAPLVDAGRGDAVRSLTAVLPIRALCVLLGIEDDLADAFTESTEAFVRAIHEDDREVIPERSYRIYDLARTAIAERRASGVATDDALDALLRIELNGAPISDEAAVGTLRQVIVAAHVGPALAMASAIKHLAEDRDLQGELRRDPAKIAAAVDELLRLHTPNTGFARTPTCPVEIGGQRIDVDEPIAVNYAAANRDPAMFPDPDALQLDRDPARNLAFGRGIHKCLGKDLALVQMRVALEVLLAHTSTFELETPAEHLPYAPFPEHGPMALPLRLGA